MIRTILISSICFIFILPINGQPGLKYAKLLTLSEKKKFSINELNSHNISVKNPAFTNDNKVEILSVSNIKYIKYIKAAQGKSRGLGALYGGIYGALPGLLLGYIAGQSASGQSSFPKLDLITNTALGFVVGTGIGVIIGVSTGKKKYKKYSIDGSQSLYDLAFPEILKDLQSDPTISVDKFNMIRNKSLK